MVVEDINIPPKSHMYILNTLRCCNVHFIEAKQFINLKMAPLEISVIFPFSVSEVKFFYFAVTESSKGCCLYKYWGVFSYLFQ